MKRIAVGTLAKPCARWRSRIRVRFKSILRQISDSIIHVDVDSGR
jgi:hypothetical protein